MKHSLYSNIDVSDETQPIHSIIKNWEWSLRSINILIYMGISTCGQGHLQRVSRGILVPLVFQSTMKFGYFGRGVGRTIITKSVKTHIYMRDHDQRTRRLWASAGRYKAQLSTGRVVGSCVLEVRHAFSRGCCSTNSPIFTWLLNKERRRGSRTIQGDFVYYLGT